MNDEKRDTNLKILHVITGLNLGGAEMMLYKLIRASPNPADHVVISFLGGIMAERIEKLGAKVHVLNLTKNPFSIRPLKLVRLIKSIAPNAVQCWMYHANLVGTIFARMAGIKNVAWGIHHSISKFDKPSIKLINRLLAAVSHCPFCRAIVCCGTNPLTACKKTNYCECKLVEIPNGFDTSLFVFSEGNRKKIRDEFDVKNNEFLILHVGRYNWLKNYDALLEIFKKLRDKNPNAKLMMVGGGVDNSQINDKIKKLAIEDSVIVTGARNDVHAIYSAADVGVLTSLSEGFPNVIGEAMLCERPFISTDVGDCAAIVADKDNVIELGDNERFANRLLEISEMTKEERTEYGKRARAHIIENFEIEKIYEKYADLWGKFHHNAKMV